MNTGFNLGIQSYCFRKFLPMRELVSALGEAGLSTVEVWPRHLHWTLESSEREKALAVLKEKGIAISAYGAVDLDNDEAEARPIFEFAQGLGIEALTTTWVAPDAFPLVEQLSQEYGVKVAIHNHGRDHHYGRFDQIQEVFSKTSPHFGLCLDTAWFLDADCDPVEAIQLFQDRLYGVHLKDFVFDDQGEHKDVIIGTGGLDLPAFMQRLKLIGFDGYLSIEYEGDPDNPLPQVKECVRAIQEVIDTVDRRALCRGHPRRARLGRV
jgi:sugar phosphate isomerase/epimerase